MVVLSLAFIAGIAESATPPINATAAFLGPEDRWPRCGIQLADAHPLWGGTVIHLEGSGECAVRLVARGQERRFILKLTPEQSLAFRKLCIDVDFAAIQIKERPGIPDEARPRITLRNAEGTNLERAKWANDKVEAFDRVYQALLALRTKTEGMRPEYEGPFQRAWKPATAPAFDITCDKKDDAVAVTAADGKVTLDITSPRGIGGATIERKGEHWPDKLVLRFRLNGLESLAISAGDMKLTASVQSHSGNAKLLRFRKGDEDGPVEKDGPYWMDIRALDADGKPAPGLPGKGGWFEMTLPKAMLTDQARAITLGWIDFYRR